MNTEKAHSSMYRLKVEQRWQLKRAEQLEYLCKHRFVNAEIDVSEDKCTLMAKEDSDKPQRKSIDATHSQTKRGAPGIIQKGINLGLSIRATIKRAMRYITADMKQVRFVTKIVPAEAYSDSPTIIITYNLGADDKYPSGANRAKEKMPILCTLTKRVNAANDGMSTATKVTPLPIP